MSDHTQQAPMLPPACVDFNKLHEEMRSGTEGDKALQAAVVQETLMADVDAAPVADSTTDALDGMRKKDLQQRARDLGISFEGDANVPRLKELLRAHPDGVPVETNPDIADESPAAPGSVADAG